MNNNIQCSIESSTTKIELNSAVDGVFLVPELEGLVGLPEIRTTSGVNAGYDGGWTSAQNYDARLISIRGVIANPDISKVEDKRRAIASLLGQGRKEQLTLRFTTEAGNAYAISVRTISCEMALQRVLTTQEFLIQLRADDPLIYDDGATSGIAAILQPQRALGGFEINFGLPLAIGGGAEDTVVDNGNETVYPVIKLYGALHSPTVVNRTTNQQMQILADLQYSIDWHTYRSATGDYILVNDGLEGAPMTLSQLLGNAEQTTYSGKNLARPNGNGTSAGVSFVWNSDGTITLNGTATNATDVWVANGGSAATEFTIPTGTNLTQSFRIVSGSASANTWAIRTNLYYGGVAHWVDVVGNTTFTATSETQVRGLEVLVPSGLTFNNLRLEIQLEKSATATTWEKYVGGAPAPNPSYPQPISTVAGAQTVQVTGKNLQPTTWAQDFVNAVNNPDNASIETFDGKNCLKYGVSAGYGSYPTENFTLGIGFKPNTQYTFSFDILKTNALARTFAIRYSDGTYTTTGGDTADEWHHYEITSTAGKNVIYAAPFYTAGDAYIDIDTFQVEIGTSASQFVPYQGQEFEVNLGKNLLDPSWMVAGYMAATGGTITYAQAQGEMACEEYIPVEPNTEYTFEIFETTDTYPEWFGISQYSTADTSGFIERNVKTGANPQTWFYTIRTKTNTHYIRPSARNLQHATKYMLSKGGRTSYAPYFTPIELCKIGNYQDRIYKNDGKWYIEKQIEKTAFDGSSDESWALGTTGSLRYPFGIDTVGKGWASSSIDGVMCDTFTLSTSSETGIAEQYQFTFRGTSYNNRLWFFCPKSAITGSTSAEVLASYKTFLSTHPTTVYYALATPTTTEITDETLRAQLNFLASLYEGENNISLVGTGAQGEMVISYATDYTVNQDIITIDSQARTITLNGQDVYHLKTSESEFLVLAPGENKLYLTSEVSDDSGYAEVKFKQGYLSI